MIDQMIFIISMILLVGAIMLTVSYGMKCD